jgi:8-oxo-dGTP pyrophosphatase MutT (NUDIX family)
MKDIKYTDEDILDHDGICAIIKDKNENILMQDHVKFGFWTLPVGKVKPGQNILEGLKDEIYEECGIKIKDVKELAVREYTYLRKGKNVKVNSHLFEILSYVGNIQNKEPYKQRQQLFMDLKTIKKLPYLSDMTLFYLETLGFKRKARL